MDNPMNSKKNYFIFIIITFLFSKGASALIIDKMIHISDGVNDYYKITNNDKFHLFVNTELSEKLIVDGLPSSEILYTADNINDWLITVNPQKMILAPMETKIVYVNKNICSDGQSCSSDKDRLFSIAFIPQVYNTGKDMEGENVGILFGFAPAFITLANKINIKYKIKVNSNANGEHFLDLKNEGNSLIKVTIDQCKTGEKSLDCIMHKTLLSGKAESINLLDDYSLGSVKVTITDGTEKNKNVYYK